MTDHERDIQIRLMQRAIEQMEPKVNAIHDKVLSVRWCPDPGACVTLTDVVQDHERRIRPLERRIWVAVGACLILSPMIALVSNYVIGKL